MDDLHNLPATNNVSFPFSEGSHCFTHLNNDGDTPIDLTQTWISHMPAIQAQNDCGHMQKSRQYKATQNHLRKYSNEMHLSSHLQTSMIQALNNLQKKYEKEHKEQEHENDQDIYAERLAFLEKKYNAMRECSIQLMDYCKKSDYKMKFRQTRSYIAKLLQQTNEMMHDADGNVRIKVELLINYGSDIIKCIDNIRAEYFLNPELATFSENSTTPHDIGTNDAMHFFSQRETRMRKSHAQKGLMIENHSCANSKCLSTHREISFNSECKKIADSIKGMCEKTQQLLNKNRVANEIYHIKDIQNMNVSVMRRVNKIMKGTNDSDASKIFSRLMTTCNRSIKRILGKMQQTISLKEREMFENIKNCNAQMMNLISAMRTHRKMRRN